MKPFLVRWRNSVYICSGQDWFKRKLGTEIFLRYELNLCTGVLHYQGLQWNEFPKNLYKICASERVSVTFSPEQDWCKRKLGHNRHNKETKMTYLQINGTVCIIFYVKVKLLWQIYELFSIPYFQKRMIVAEAQCLFSSGLTW